MIATGSSRSKRVLGELFRRTRPVVDTGVAIGALAIVLAGVSVSCSDTLAEGEIGTPRVVGNVRGLPPIPVYAPAADRAGNVYILAGTRDLPEVTAFVGRVGGGFSGGCRLTKGDKLGPLGWVGFSQDTQWYWAGNALVRMKSVADCSRVLDRDPASGTDLLMRAVFPWVRDTPSKTTMVAMAGGPGDPQPFTLVIDLAAEIYTSRRAFEPANARDVNVLGAGASAKLRQEFAVLSFVVGDTRRTEGRFLDENGELVGRIPIANAGDIPAYGIRGFLEASDAGLVAGLTNDKRLVLFDGESGRTIPVTGMDPVGVHRWDGALYLVGSADDRPVIAPILDDGSLGPVALWSAAARLDGVLRGAIDVTDDRTPPRRSLRFDPARPAHRFPLVTEHTSVHYADNTTLTLIAGPTFGEGADAFSMIAVVPVGVTYP